MTDTTPSPYPVAAPMTPEDQRLWATLVHIGGVIFHLWPALIGYLVLKERGGFIRQHTATALNFQLTLLIAYVVGIITAFIFVGFLVILAAAVVDIVFSIIAAVAAHRGEHYVYPIAFRFVQG
ncbi:MAG: hypothetical protein JWO10_2012 [Microbacteriaceae bacterium]|nr:hypothetical protein [Microbacteriaceae bacterium]